MLTSLLLTRHTSVRRKSVLKRTLFNVVKSLPKSILLNAPFQATFIIYIHRTISHQKKKDKTKMLWRVQNQRCELSLAGCNLLPNNIEVQFLTTLPTIESQKHPVFQLWEQRLHFQLKSTFEYVRYNSVHLQNWYNCLIILLRYCQNVRKTIGTAHKMNFFG